MQRFASDGRLRRTLGEAAAQHARTLYSIDSTADRLVALYREMAGGR